MYRNPIYYQIIERNERIRGYFETSYNHYLFDEIDLAPYNETIFATGYYKTLFDLPYDYGFDFSNEGVTDNEDNDDDENE